MPEIELNIRKKNQNEYVQEVSKRSDDLKIENISLNDIDTNSNQYREAKCV
jgi:hypothetical protein